MHSEHILTLSAWPTEAQEQEIMALTATGTGRWQRLVRSIQSMKLVPLRKSRSVSQMERVRQEAGTWHDLVVLVCVFLFVS